MVFSPRQLHDMGAPPLPAVQPRQRHFPQWSRTALLTLSSVGDDAVQEVKKSPPASEPAGFIISGDPVARVSHLEHSVRFLQEQHRLMLNGLHAEIEALRERNRDLQFQLLFNKESSPKPTSPTTEEIAENNKQEITKLKSEVSDLEKEASAARGEARAYGARALQLQRLVDVQTEKLRELELKQTKCVICEENTKATTAGIELEGTECGTAIASAPGAGAEGGIQAGAEAGAQAGAGRGGGEDSVESRAELRARLAEAEKLVRRLRAEAERRRRELQCMKNSLHASLRASGIDPYGFQNNYHFPPVHHTPDFWREPLRDEFAGARGRSTRRPLTLPELTSQGIPRSTVYANNHTSRPRQNGYDKNKKPQLPSNEVANGQMPEQDQQECRLNPNYLNFLPNINECNVDPNATYPQLKICVTKMIPHGNVSHASLGGGGEARRARRPHRRHVADHT